MSLTGRWWNIGILVISVLLLILWSSRLVRDVRAYLDALDMKRAHLAEVERLKVQRSAAHIYVRDLRSDPATIERLIRSSGYVRPDETVYVIPRPRPSVATVAPVADRRNVPKTNP